MRYLVHTMAKRNRSRQLPEDRDYELFAEQFVDMILDPTRPWLFQFFATGGFKIVPTEEEINSGVVARRILNSIDVDSWMLDSWLFQAIEDKDRGKLVPWFKQVSKKANLTREHLARIVLVGNTGILRKSLKKLENIFKSHPGPRPKLPRSKYPEVLQLANQLKPAIRRLLVERQSGTKHSLMEILEYLRIDYPEAYSFLHSHIYQLQQVINHPQLRERAKKRIDSQARVFADALAGTDYGLTPRTSLERVSEARRVVSIHSE